MTSPAAQPQLPAGSRGRQLLSLLQRTAGRAIPVVELMAEADVSSLAALRMHISQLRKQLGSSAYRLQTVRGLGYRWDSCEGDGLVPRSNLLLDVHSHRIVGGDRIIRLTRVQALLLQELTATPGRVVCVSSLQASAGVTSSRSIVTHLSALRRALAPLGGSTIHAVRGRGYEYRGSPISHVCHEWRPAAE